MSSALDLNCDLGESFGAWAMGDDAGVMPWITSANIACGFHAGDPVTMQATVAQAVAAGVALGAHVGLPDLVGFGRREMRISAADAYAMTLCQIGALAAFARAAGSRLAHVKPHGALYNMAARDAALAEAIARAVRDFDPALVLVGLAGSELPRAGEAAGLRVAHEVFADRGYAADGTLLPRGAAGAVIEELDAATAQAVSLATRGEVRAVDGTRLALRADTLCLHGDRPEAARWARRIHDALRAADVALRAFPSPSESGA